MARLLALANVAMADAGIAIWESKYFYEFWRPVAAIRESDPGTGGSDPGVVRRFRATATRDRSGRDFHAIGRAASNLNPPTSRRRSRLPSGHAGFGGALFETLKDFYARMRYPHLRLRRAQWVTKDADGRVRPSSHAASQRSQAAEENVRSDLSRHPLRLRQKPGDRAGTAGGDYVFHHAFVPVR